jgi:hypothetical protein
MSRLEFYRVLAPVVAAIKCGHTSVSLPREYLNSSSAEHKLLPLAVRVLASKVYIWRDLSGNPAPLAGKEIRSINGIPTSKIVDNMLEATPGDGDIQTSRMSRISGLTFAVELLTLFGLTGPYELGLWDPKEGHEIRVRLEGAERARLEEMARAKLPQDQSSELAGDLRFLDEGKISVMKIRQFGGYLDSQREKTLKEFYEESFETMNRKGTKTLILDLRNNGGGANELGKLLRSYLLDSSFQYYDELVINAVEFPKLKEFAHFSKVPEDRVERRPNGKYRAREKTHPNLGLQQPSQPTFQGTVLILINGGSFSTTAEFLSQAHFRRRATFIGEEAGGGYYGNSSGMVPAVTLPNSKLVLHVPLVTYYLAVKGYKEAARGLIPDYPIHYTIEELLEGTDEELSLALELARKN